MDKRYDHSVKVRRRFEGVDNTKLEVSDDVGCEPADIITLLAKAEFHKREKECDSLKSSYFSIWSKLRRGNPTNMGGLAAVMQHGYRMKKDSNEFDTTVQKTERFHQITWLCTIFAILL